jgi:hypothetical protein
MDRMRGFLEVPLKETTAGNAANQQMTEEVGDGNNNPAR